MSELPPGKLPAALLMRLLEDRGSAVGEVVGPGIGLDGAVLRLGRSPTAPDAESCASGDVISDAGSRAQPETASDTAPDTGRDPGPFLVAASDPITFTADGIGWYAVHVNANDVACMGALPRWFLATVLLPAGARETMARQIFDDVERACRQVGAGLVGGHTEVTPGLDRPLVVGTMLGLTERWISAAGGRPGDALVLTKGAGIEGTAILAERLAEELRREVGEDVLLRGRAYLERPGLSVVPEARIALEAGRPTALHDPTEGGVAGGIHELCEASGTGARIDRDALRIGDETRAICDALEIDPLGLIGSGALLMAASEADVAPILAALGDEGVEAERVGTLTDPDDGITLRSADGSIRDLPRFDSDEITRVL